MGNVSWDTTQPDLWHTFSRFGRVTHISLRHARNARAPAYAFVQYDDKEAVRLASAFGENPGIVLGGRRLRVEMREGHRSALERFPQAGPTYVLGPLGTPCSRDAVAETFEPCAQQKSLIYSPKAGQYREVVPSGKVHGWWGSNGSPHVRVQTPGAGRWEVPTNVDGKYAPPPSKGLYLRQSAGFHNQYLGPRPSKSTYQQYGQNSSRLVECSPKSIRAVIGVGGSTLRAIEEASGADVRIIGKAVHLTGLEASVMEAQRLVHMAMIGKPPGADCDDAPQVVLSSSALGDENMQLRAENKMLRAELRVQATKRAPETCVVDYKINREPLREAATAGGSCESSEVVEEPASPASELTETTSEVSTEESVDEPDTLGIHFPPLRTKEQELAEAAAQKEGKAVAVRPDQVLSSRPASAPATLPIANAWNITKHKVHRRASSAKSRRTRVQRVESADFEALLAKYGPAGSGAEDRHLERARAPSSGSDPVSSGSDPASSESGSDNGDEESPGKLSDIHDPSHRQASMLLPRMTARCRAVDDSEQSR
eukprot:COSAG01_NODE_6328_length_3733_cov_3.043478_5_plen_542_part_00